MVIDPRLYQKMSGRTGDPYERLGQALAQQSKKESHRNQAPQDSVEDAVFRRYKAKWIVSIGFSILVLIALAWGLLF